MYSKRVWGALKNIFQGRGRLFKGGAYFKKSLPGGALIRGGRLFKGALIQGNTVFESSIMDNWGEQ